MIDSLTPLGVQEEFIAATAACLLIRAQDFDAIGGFDEDFAVVFNDVDLCLRLREGGGAVVVTPDVEIVHHESISRGGISTAKPWPDISWNPVTYAENMQRCSPAAILFRARCSTPTAPFPTADAGACVNGTGARALDHELESPSLGPQPRAPIDSVCPFRPGGACDRADLIPLLNSYQEHGDVVFISASPRLRWRWRTLRQLRSVCQAILIRRNEGYDFGKLDDRPALAGAETGPWRAA